MKLAWAGPDPRGKMGALENAFSYTRKRVSPLSRRPVRRRSPRLGVLNGLGGEGSTLVGA